MAARASELRASPGHPTIWRLENPFLRVDFDSHGCLVAFFDKRTQREVLGDLLRFSGPTPRGSVRLFAQDVPDADAPASLLVGGLLPDGLSFQVRYELGPTEAKLVVESRLANRLATRFGLGRMGFEASLGGPGSLSWAAKGRGVCAYNPVSQTGLAVFGRACDLEGATFEDDWLSVRRPPKTFYPRETETWRFTLVPVTGLPRVDAFDEDVAMAIGESLVVQANRALPDHRFDLLDRAGQTYSLPAHLYAERALVVPLGALALPKRLALVPPDGSPRIVWDSERKDTPPTPEPPTQETDVVEGQLSAALERFERFERIDDALERAEASFPLRAAALTLGAIQSVRDHKWSEAESRFESALLYNAEDPLAWWGQAVAQRLRGSDEETPALLNAHYLSPFEPALRAESFLAQPVSEGAEPSPVLRDLAEDPPSAVEAACLYMEAGLFDQAARLLEELLRFGENLRLRRLLAACYLVGTRMEAHAAEQVARIGPFDVWVRHHPVEDWAIRALTARFG